MNPCPQCDRGLVKATGGFCLSCNGTGYEQAPSPTEDKTVRGEVKKVAAKVTKAIKKVVKRK